MTATTEQLSAIRNAGRDLADDFRRFQRDMDRLATAVKVIDDPKLATATIFEGLNTPERREAFDSIVAGLRRHSPALTDPLRPARMSRGRLVEDVDGVGTAGTLVLWPKPEPMVLAISERTGTAYYLTADEAEEAGLPRPA